MEASYLHEWAELIRPPALEDVPAELLAALPSFEAEALMELAFTPEYRPPLTRWLPRRPPQPDPTIPPGLQGQPTARQRPFL